MNQIRREKMREFIEKNQTVTIEQLTEVFDGISLMTIHRDLTFLEKQGFIIKVRGGARYIVDSSKEPIFAAREIIGRNEKQRIAAKAIGLLKGSGSVFIDAGTTTMAFTKEIPDTRVNIMTTGPNIALELSKHSLPTISLCGGVLNKNNLTLSGLGACEIISRINIDTAFLVASGYSAECGFTCGIEDEANIKRMVVSKARRLVMLIDSGKFGKVLPYTFADIKDFDYIVTDNKPENLSQDFLETAGINDVTVL